MSQQAVSFPLAGGLDLVTPAVRMPPGKVIASLNYQPVAGGYRRVRGYERFDGRAAPSDATSYHVVHFTGGDSDIDAIVQGTEIGLDVAASNTWRFLALAPAVITSGTTAGGDAAGYIGATFIADTNIAAAAGTLRFGGAIYGTLDGAAVENEAVPEAADGAWLALAKTVRRDAIAAVPGSGPVMGVWITADQFGENPRVVAVRDNAGATAGVMHRSGAKENNVGWAAVTLALEFTFDSGGTDEPEPGDEIAGDTSGASGRITGIVLSSGSWAGGDAAGTISVLVSSGTFQNGEDCTVREFTPVVNPVVTFPAVLTLTSAGIAYVLPAGGSYEFLTHNFYGASNLTRMYGVNGVGNAFTYDRVANTLAPIVTGMETDTPDHIAEHNGALFLSFPGGSIQFSTVGEPLLFDPIVGAGEIGLGCDVTSLMSATESALAILGENRIAVLYGHDSSDYILETLNDQAGAIAKSAQRIGEVTYLDNAGIRTLSSSARFGNFTFGSLSQLIAPLLEEKRDDGADPATAFIVRHKTQYWLLFDDGTAIVGCFAKKEPEFLAVDLGFTPTCSCSVEIDGEERIFIGADDGYVYEFDKGTSFDGAVIPHNLELAWAHFGAPHVEKRAHKFSLDLEASGAATLTAEVRFDNGAVTGLAAQNISVTDGSGALDFAEVYIDGIARNFSVKIAGSTSDEEPHTLTGASFHITPRKVRR